MCSRKVGICRSLAPGTRSEGLLSRARASRQVQQPEAVRRWLPASRRLANRQTLARVARGTARCRKRPGAVFIITLAHIRLGKMV